MQQNEESVPIKRRLGRGLNALIGGSADDADIETPYETTSEDSNQIAIDLIERNPYQPRKDFDADSLKELSSSIRQHGVLQPLLVRPHEGGYQLIAGERRCIAARQAGLSSVPCRVLEIEDRQLCEIAIEENLKRKDLNVLEKAEAFQDYLQRFECTIEELARQLSLDRSTVSNMLRLLDLPEAIKESLRAGRITNGHARALLSLQEEDQVALCQQVEKESLSVRKTEAAVREILKQAEIIPFDQSQSASGKPKSQPLSNHVQSLQDQLRDTLGAKVEIQLRGKESGKITIHFQTNDDFERIIRNLRRAA